jgi:hypothetical protein
MIAVAIGKQRRLNKIISSSRICPGGSRNRFGQRGADLRFAQQ